MLGLQEVVNSGLSCIVLRVGKTEGVDESLGSESAVVLGAQQSLPSQSVITKSQVEKHPHLISSLKQRTIIFTGMVLGKDG